MIIRLIKLALLATFIYLIGQFMYVEHLNFFILFGLFSFFIFIIAFIYRQKQLHLYLKNEYNITHILFDGAATHLDSECTMGGWLSLTDQQLIFVALDRSFSHYDLIIWINDIQKIEKSRHFNLFKTVIKITLINGQIERFNVHSSTDWLKQIHSNILL